MRKLALIAVFLGAGMMLDNPVTASAHGKDSHGDSIDTQMQNLHAMMPMFSITSAELESALEKGDSTVAKAQAEKILAAIPDLKQSRPHKNIKQQKKFVEFATNLDKTLTSTVDLIQKNNFSGAKTTFKKVEEICAACHAKFRD